MDQRGHGSGGHDLQRGVFGGPQPELKGGLVNEHAEAVGGASAATPGPIEQGCQSWGVDQIHDQLPGAHPFDVDIKRYGRRYRAAAAIGPIDLRPPAVDGTSVPSPS